MKRVMIKTKQEQFDLELDFNKQIKSIIKLLDIEISDGEVIISQLNNSIVDTNKSFKQNNIQNNDVLKVGVRYAIEF